MSIISGIVVCDECGNSIPQSKADTFGWEKEKEQNFCPDCWRSLERDWEEDNQNATD